MANTTHYQTLAYKTNLYSTAPQPYSISTSLSVCVCVCVYVENRSIVARGSTLSEVSPLAACSGPTPVLLAAAAAAVVGFADPAASSSSRRRGLADPTSCSSLWRWGSRIQQHARPRVCALGSDGMVVAACPRAVLRRWWPRF